MTLKSLWPISRETRLALVESEQFGEREFDAVLPREVVNGMEIKFDGRNYLATRKVINPEGWSTVIMTSTERILQYKLTGVIISMWICTLIVIPMIINYRTFKSAKMLRASETRYRELFDNISSGVVIYEVKDGGKDLILKDFNKAGERIDGVRKEDIIGKSIHEVWPRMKEFGLLDVFERVWKTGIPEHHPASFYHDEKVALWYENFVYKLPTGEMVSVYDEVTDRMRAEEALRESEGKYRELVEHANSIILHWTRDGQITFLNEFGQRFFGYSEAEILGQHVVGTIVPETESTGRDLRPLMDQICADPIAFEHNVNENMRRNGERVWIAWTNKVDLDHQNRVAGILSIGMNITERKQAEIALRESEELYRTLVNLSPDAISVADLNGLLTFTSPKAMQMFGYSPDDEILGRSILCWVAPEEQEKASANILHLLTEGTLTDTEYTLIKKDGTRFIGEVNAAVIHSPDGSPMRMIVITRDVTERKQAEDALRLSERRLRRAEVVACFGNWEFIRGCDKVKASEGARIIYGFEGNEWPISEVQGIPLPEYRGMLDKALNGLIEEGKPYNVEFKIRRPTDGKIIDIHSIAEYSHEKGIVFGVVQDISEGKRAKEERKKLEEQLFQAQKMESIGRLAGGVAHDFNNMLGVIIGRAEMALEQDVATDKLQENVKEILKAGQRSADLTRQLLAFARRQTAIPKILDLNDTISGMLKMLRRLIGEDVGLSWQPGLDLWKVKIDPSQVDQILVNLVVNARDAIPGIGAITIRTENVVVDDSIKAEHLEIIPGEYILLTVSDRGSAG